MHLGGLYAGLDYRRLPSPCQILEGVGRRFMVGCSRQVTDLAAPTGGAPSNGVPHAG